MEKKKIFLILVGVAVVACITFFFIFFLNYVVKRMNISMQGNSDSNKKFGEEIVNSENASTTNENGLSKEEQQIKDYSEKYTVAKEASDSGLCEGIGTDEMIDNCILLVLRENLNIEACANLKNKDKISSCENMVRYEKAIKENSPSECDLISIPSSVNHCVVSLINNNGYKEKDCSLFSNDSSVYCEEYLEYLNQMELSKNPQSSSDCENIKDEPAKLNCLSKFGIIQ